jgi:hypothetical protein
VTKFRTSGFRRGAFEGGPCHGLFSNTESANAWPMAHMPELRSDTSTVVASPVRSRWNSAPMIPPAIVMAPMESPKPGPGGPGM